MTAQDARDQREQHQRHQAPATLSDNDLKATIYFSVGVASEGSSRGRNVAYELSFAGYIHQQGETSRRPPIEAGAFREGQLEPIYNSGYSIGTLQTDFGQQRNDPNRNADQLLNAYQEWARGQARENPNLVLTQAEYGQASEALRRQGNEIRGDRTIAADNGYDIPAGIKTKLNQFMASDTGITYVHNQDVRQVNHLLREGGAIRQLEDTALYRNATQDDQIRMATVMAKLENQDGNRHWPGIIRQINNGGITSLEGIKAGVPEHLHGDRDNALRGAEVMIALRNADAQSPLHAAWQNVVANPLVNPTQLTQDRVHPHLEAEYSTVKNLFLVPGQSKAFVQASDDGGHRAQDVRFQGAPREQTAGLYVSGNNLVQWNRDGHGHANIGGQWSEIERSQIARVDRGNGVVDLNITRNGATTLLLHIDPREPALRPGHPNQGAPQHHPEVPGMRGPGERPGAPERDGPGHAPDRHGPPQRQGLLMLDDPAHQNYGMFAALLRVVNDRGETIDPDRRPSETVAKQVAGGLVEEARKRELDTIGNAKFTADGTKVAMTDTKDLDAPWARTAVGDVGQLAGQRLERSSENVAVINQRQALEQTLKPPTQTQGMDGPDGPAPKGPRLA